MRYALVGGTFNPPHVEHVNIIKQAYKELGADKVIVLPSHNPPHKHTHIKTCHRMSMIRLAVDAIPYVEISDIELRSEDYGYSAKILPLVTGKYGADMTFVIGGDSLMDMHTWRDYKKLLTDYKIAVFIRDDKGEAIEKLVGKYRLLYNADISIMNYRPSKMSSSGIRLDVELGLETDGRLDATVMEYIENNDLYTNYKDALAELKIRVAERTAAHCIRTARYAVELNRRAKLQEKQVVLAALLHDIAKNVDYKPYNVPECVPEPVAHQWAGELIARNELGVSDEEVLTAIKWHATGNARMTRLAKLIYVADMLEPERHFEGIEVLRDAALTDIDKAYSMCITSAYGYLIAAQKVIEKNTIESYNYYKEIK